MPAGEAGQSFWPSVLSGGKTRETTISKYFIKLLACQCYGLASIDNDLIDSSGERIFNDGFTYPAV